MYCLLISVCVLVLYSDTLCTCVQLAIGCLIIIAYMYGASTSVLVLGRLSCLVSPSFVTARYTSSNSYFTITVTVDININCHIIYPIHRAFEGAVYHIEVCVNNQQRTNKLIHYVRSFAICNKYKTVVTRSKIFVE